jgi:hypothetical protein
MRALRLIEPDKSLAVKTADFRNTVQNREKISGYER